MNLEGPVIVPEHLRVDSVCSLRMNILMRIDLRRCYESILFISTGAC